MSAVKKIIATAAVIPAIGAGIGFLGEKSADSVAHGRVVTAGVCLASTHHNDTINEELLNCLQEGVPGGNRSGPGFHEGDPIADVASFRRHEQLQAHFDLGKVAVDAGEALLIAALAVITIGGAVAVGGAGDYS